MTSVNTQEVKDQMLETTNVMTNIQTAINYQKQVVMEEQSSEMVVVYVRIVVHHVNGKTTKKPKVMKIKKTTMEEVLYQTLMGMSPKRRNPKRRNPKRRNPKRKNQKTRNQKNL